MFASNPLHARKTVLVGVLSALFLIFSSSDALAQGAVAESQFREAKEHYDAGDYKDALQFFQLAWEHSHSPNARLYVARSFLKLGKLAPAYDEFRGTLRDATQRVDKDEKYVGTQSAAAAELVLLEPKIGHLVVSLDATAGPDVEVLVNGAALPGVRVGVVMTVEPGEFKIEASAPDQPPFVRTVQVEGGKTQAVSVFFASSNSAAATTSKTASEPAGDLSTLQVTGVVLTIAGVGALLAAGATGVAAASKFAALDSACGGVPCTQPGFDDVIDSGKTFELVSYIVAGAGGAMAITGAALWIFGGDDESPKTGGVDLLQTVGVELTPIVTPLPGGAFAGLGGRF